MALRRSAPFSRIRPLLIILFLAFFPGIREAYGGFIASIAPLGASEDVIIDITGAGFDPVASKNMVVFTHEGVDRKNAAVTISALDQNDQIGTNAGPKAGLSRIGVAVPEGLPAGTARVKVVNMTTGEVIEGGSIEVIGITLEDTASARPGSSVDIRITGTPNARFVTNGTVTAFGEGVRVNSETVESDTSIVANITVAPDARAGVRSIGLMTESQVAVLLRAFTVKEGPVRLADAGDNKDPLGLDAADGSESISYIFAPFDEDKSVEPAATASAEDAAGDAKGPLGDAKPTEPKDEAADVKKVAGDVKPEEIKTGKAEVAGSNPSLLVVAQPAKTKENAVKPVKEATADQKAVKAEDVNMVASVKRRETEGPSVISLKTGIESVNIVALSDGYLNPAECISDEAEKITPEPGEDRFAGANLLISGDTESTVKDVPDTKKAEPPPAGSDGEDSGVVRKVLVAFLGPFILIGYLLSHLWKW